MIEINGKVYRNLQEQVEKNKDDIEELQDSKQDNLTAGDNITITDNVISAAGGITYTAGEGININTTQSQTIISVNSTIARSTKVYTKEESNQTFVPRNIEFDDEDNPEVYRFATPTEYSGYMSMNASQDDNNHPCDAGVYVSPSRVRIEANDYNHGPGDDTYTGAIEVYDSGVYASKLDATDYTTKTYNLTRYNVRHDLLLYIVDDSLHYGVVHMIFTDNYDYPYDYAKIFRDWRSYIYPEVYYRSCNSQTLDNLGGDRIYPNFYIDNSDELWFEEQDDFYSGSTYTEESVNSYHVLACNDKITKF